MGRRLWSGATLLALAATPGAAQRLRATEAGLGGAVAVARHTFAGVELGVAYRPGGQGRVALALATGAEAGRVAARAHLTAQFLLTPSARSGTGVYAGLGAAFAARRTAAGRGFLAVLVGLEGAPGAAGRGWDAWYVELGIGGGIRAAAGWRTRWFPAWRPAGGSER